MAHYQVMRAATLEAQATETSKGQRSNEAIVADIETVTSPLQIMDKVSLVLSSNLLAVCCDFTQAKFFAVLQIMCVQRLAPLWCLLPLSIFMFRTCMILRPTALPVYFLAASGTSDFESLTTKIASEFSGLQALEAFGNDIAIAFSGAEDVALVEYAHLTGRPFRVFR